jgi:hypothetical protein
MENNVKQVIIDSSSHFEDMEFGGGILILNGADVHLSNVRISGNGIEITEKGKLSMKNSVICDVETGINVDSYCILRGIHANEFRRVKSGIKFNSTDAALEEENSISGNIFLVDGDGEAVSIKAGLNIRNSTETTADISKLARKICLMNNETLVKVHGKLSDITTTIFRVQNSEELEQALLNCSTGNIIKLSGGNYYGNLIVDKEITIIGEGMDETVIVPREYLNKDCIECGIRIKSGNVCIEKLCIDGKNNRFMDGIRYEDGIFPNNEFKSICIKNTVRRGISVWPEDKKDTVIKGCIFENIKEHQVLQHSRKKSIRSFKEGI